MSTLSQFAGSARVPKVIANYFSTSGITSFAPTVNTTFSKKSITGLVSANTLVQALLLTGSGVVNMFFAYSIDNTSRTHRVRITIDGTVVFDATSGACVTTNDGVVAVGFVGAGSNCLPDQIPFNSSFLAEYASSLPETGKTGFGYIYRTN